MKKITLFGILISLSFFFIQCKSESKSNDFTTLTKTYFHKKNLLNPLDATLNGQSDYNAQLVFEMTDSQLIMKRYQMKKKIALTLSNGK
jgi:hypothetical protein